MQIQIKLRFGMVNSINIFTDKKSLHTTRIFNLNYVFINFAKPYLSPKYIIIHCTNKNLFDLTTKIKKTFKNFLVCIQFMAPFLLKECTLQTKTNFLH